MHGRGGKDGELWGYGSRVPHGWEAKGPTSVEGVGEGRWPSPVEKFIMVDLHRKVHFPGLMRGVHDMGEAGGEGEGRPDGHEGVEGKEERGAEGEGRGGGRGIGEVM